MKKNRLKYHRVIKTAIIAFSAALLVVFIVDLIFPVKVSHDFSLLIIDCHNEPVHAFLNNEDKWRMECRYEELPQDVIKAIVNKEDKIDIFSSI